MIVKVAFLTAVTFFQVLRAQLDLDGDGMSDVWATLHNAQNLVPTGDADSDGFTNLEESISGTDPFLSSSRFEIHDPQRIVSDRTVNWRSVIGKSYQLFTSPNLVSWSPFGNPITGTNASMSIELPSLFEREFLRISVADVDHDRDGLSAYEESLLGYSDSNAHSASSNNGNDFAAALSLFGTSGSFTFQGQATQGTPPTMAEASRFVQQATMGADYETIQSISTIGYSAWIDAQFALPATSHAQRNVELTIGPPNERFSEYIWTWWDVNITAPDMLRQRVAFALSEIFVISQNTVILEDQHLAVATYYDLFVNGAFGNFRDLLYDVSVSPAMGFYLSHVKNRPTDLTNNIFPDENFAREIMQLFSIGLFELNVDGSRRKDTSGNDIPTYDNSNITEFARIFTGFTYNPEDPNDTPPIVASERILTVSDYLNAEPEWMYQPMYQFEPMHEVGVKNLLNGQSTNGTIQQDLDAAIDNLFNHPNVGPFIGRLLIQRLVKSTPSSGYVGRVATAFADNGSGVRGDMKAVIRAILLDPEARNGSSLNDPLHGKLREPVIRHLHLVRAFNISSSDGRFRNFPLFAFESYNQQPMLAPSVFNFYLPDHSPIGILNDNGLFAPEFQITTATTTLKTLNYWSRAIPMDTLITPIEEGGISPSVFTMDYSDEIALASNPDALLDRLDILLTRGQMTSATRGIIRNALVSANGANVPPGDLVRFAVSLIASSADFSVLL
ncbi:MAG: DUF1800 family protein [Verrucomicrobiota bacterium]